MKKVEGSSGFAQDGGIRPLNEGYIRKGGQNPQPVNAAPRPAPPAAFRPASAPTPTTPPPAPTNGGNGRS